MRSSRPKCAASAVLFLLAPLPAYAAEYYVAPTGAETNPGTLAQPFASIAKAQSVAVAGDTVFLRGGRYAFAAGTTQCASGTATIAGVVLNKSGAAGRLIKYWAYPGEIPVFDFAGMTDSCRIRGFQVSGSFIHLKGIEVKNVLQNNSLNHESWGVWINGSNNVFELLNVHHIMGAGVFIQDGGGNLVLNSDSHDNYDEFTSNGAGESADGFGCHVSANKPGNVFRGCRAWWNTDDGFDLINAFSAVTIENSWAWYSGYLPGTMTASKNGNGIKAGGYGTDVSTFPADPPKHTVRSCLAVSNRSAGFYANHHPSSGFFYNNTAYGNGANFNMLGMSPTGADIAVGILRNNIALMGTALSNGAGIDAANNSWTLPVTVSTADFRSVAVAGLDAPRQADGSLPVIANFHLAVGSDLVDKGADIGLPFVGPAPDLGAFELGASEDGGTGLGPGSGGGMDAGGPGAVRDAGGARDATAADAGGRGGAGSAGAGAGGGAAGSGGAGGSGGAATGGNGSAGSNAPAGQGGAGGTAVPPVAGGSGVADASSGGAPAPAEGGCSCHTATRARSPGLAGALLFLASAGVWRKRSSARLSRTRQRN